MKAILATLLCYVFFQAQCFAHKGGPFDGQKGQIVTTGTYSAILVPNESGTVGQNTLGLFTMVVPKTGLATGTAFMFGFGATFSGTVQGAVDPKTAKLYAVINTEHDITVATSDTTTLVVVFLANGNLNGNKIIAGKGTTGVRITGESSITFSTSEGGSAFLPGFPDQPQTVVYTVLGFKQA